MEKQVFDTGNPGELILPGRIHQIKMLRLRSENETLSPAEREKAAFELWQMEEELERVTN